MPLGLMIARFNGPAGESNLRVALQRQKIVQHDVQVAEKLTSKGTLIEYPARQTIIQQDADDDFVYFILSGAVDVHVQGRVIARRSQDETVGEMVAVDPAEPRSATARTTRATVVLRVPALDFIKIAQEHSGVWRALCAQLASRLREPTASFTNQMPGLYFSLAQASRATRSRDTFNLASSMSRSPSRSGQMGCSGLPA